MVSSKSKIPIIVETHGVRLTGYRQTSNSDNNTPKINIRDGVLYNEMNEEFRINNDVNGDACHASLHQ